MTTSSQLRYWQNGEPVIEQSKCQTLQYFKDGEPFLMYAHGIKSICGVAYDCIKTVAGTSLISAQSVASLVD